VRHPAKADLSVEEAALARAYGERRLATFTAGRVALRAALCSLGIEGLELGIGATERGAPRVDPRAVGSISHKDHVAVGLAAVRRGAERVGVDVEVVAPLRVDISGRILCADEREEWAGLATDERDRALRVVFSVKEAIYKAIDPFVARYVGFREVRLSDVGAATRARGELVVEARLAPAPETPLAIEARFTTLDVRGETLIVAEARAEEAR
jgi:4'-phosphopantetheinyl transferase EntD